MIPVEAPAGLRVWGVAVRELGLSAYRTVVHSKASNGGGGVRSIVHGWSEASCRRFEAKLQTVDPNWLSGLQGFTVTLTIGSDIPMPSEWLRWKRLLLLRLYRLGVPGCWCVEFQRRGAPHFHIFVASSSRRQVVDLVGWWVRLTGGSPRGQCIEVPRGDGAAGWLKYCAKHGSRSVHHYQRSPDSIPESWRGASTGRMWGVFGSWAFKAVKYWFLSDRDWFILRRRVRRYWRTKWLRGRGGFQGWGLHQLLRGLTLLPCPPGMRSVLAV